MCYFLCCLLQSANPRATGPAAVEDTKSSSDEKESTSREDAPTPEPGGVSVEDSHSDDDAVAERLDSSSSAEGAVPTARPDAAKPATLTPANVSQPKRPLRTPVAKKEFISVKPNVLQFNLLREATATASVSNVDPRIMVDENTCHFVCFYLTQLSPLFSCTNSRTDRRQNPTKQQSSLRCPTTQTAFDEWLGSLLH